MLGTDLEAEDLRLEKAEGVAVDLDEALALLDGVSNYSWTVCFGVARFG